MKNVQKKPEIIVFAGPNGSGKSTLTEILRPPQMDYINADEIKKNLKEALINSATSPWRIFFALSLSTNPPHSLCYASGLSP